MKYMILFLWQYENVQDKLLFLRMQDKLLVVCKILKYGDNISLTFE